MGDPVLLLYHSSDNPCHHCIYFFELVLFEVLSTQQLKTGFFLELRTHTLFFGVFVTFFFFFSAHKIIISPQEERSTSCTYQSKAHEKSKRVLRPNLGKKRKKRKKSEKKQNAPEKTNDKQQITLFGSIVEE